MISDDISSIIDEKVGEVRIDALDMSFGEILGLRANNELIIDPDYQRFFRWSFIQQSRLIESILLGLPIPQIYVIENVDGTFELIDGLQRVASVIHFLQPEKGLVGGDGLEEQNTDEIPFLRLVGCDIVSDLNGLVAEDLPLAMRLKVKRSGVRVTIIKKQSKSHLRYEMFKRLNTGGSILSEQEVRNCTARLIGEKGISFYTFLKECASSEEFFKCTEKLSDSEKSRKQDEELVLRFFALKNAQDLFRGSVSDFLDNYMEEVALGKKAFDRVHEKILFLEVFGLLANSMGGDAFVRFKEERAIGTLAPAIFEGTVMGVYRKIEAAKEMSSDELRSKLIAVRQSKTFLVNIGPGANSKQKLEGRIAAVENAIK